MAPDFVAISGVFKTSLTMKDTYPQYHPCWWFDNYLPEPYRSEAIELCDGDFETVTDLKRAISLGFVWPEGTFKQWCDLAVRADLGEFNQPQQ